MISLMLTRYRSPQLRSATVANEFQDMLAAWCHKDHHLGPQMAPFGTPNGHPWAPCHRSRVTGHGVTGEGAAGSKLLGPIWEHSGPHLGPKAIPTDPKVATKEAKGLQRHPKTLRGNHFSTKNSNVLDLPEQAQKQTSKQSQVHAPFEVFWNTFGSQRATSGPFWPTVSRFKMKTQDTVMD